MVRRSMDTGRQKSKPARKSPVQNLFILLCVVCPFASLAEVPDPDTVFERQQEWRKNAEPAEYRQFTRRFMALFNAEDIDALVGLASEEMAAKQNMENFARFLRDFRASNGPVDSLGFKFFDTRGQRGDKVPTAVYLATFADGDEWDLRFHVVERQRLNRLLILDNNFNEDLPLYRNRSSVALPFPPGEEWYVLWGGETEEQNYHVVSRAQKNAYDFLIRHPFSKRSYLGSGEHNEDYFAFGQPLHSPVSGEVVSVITGVADNTPGNMNRAELTGNTVVIRTPENEFLLLAHLKQGSVAVAPGDQVETGQVIGAVGNSGHSSEPHLHLHLMDGPDFETATGIKIHFEEVGIDGIATAQRYAPVQGDRISHPGNR